MSDSPACNVREHQTNINRFNFMNTQHTTLKIVGLAISASVEYFISLFFSNRKYYTIHAIRTLTGANPSPQSINKEEF